MEDEMIIEKIFKQTEKNFSENPICVYIKINDKNEVIEIESSIFISDSSDWIKIDEGYGDKYSHAQTQYFSQPLQNENGIYNYKFIEGQVLEVLNEKED